MDDIGVDDGGVDDGGVVDDDGVLLMVGVVSDLTGTGTGGDVNEFGSFDIICGGNVDGDDGKCERHGGGPLLLLLCCAVDGDDVCVCDGVGWVVDEDDKRALVEDGWFVVRSVSAVRSDE